MRTMTHQLDLCYESSHQIALKKTGAVQLRQAISPSIAGSFLRVASHLLCGLRSRLWASSRWVTESIYCGHSDDDDDDDEDDDDDDDG